MKSILLILPFLILSCTNKTTGHSDTDSKSSSGITEEQQEASDAFSLLQISSDTRNRLYTTFANIKQPCYPADTSFVISQSQFLTYMKDFVSRHYTNLPAKQQDHLSERSVKAQEEYKVLHCSDRSENENYENGLPMTGTWVIPNVMGRSDVVLVWEIPKQLN